MAFYDLPGEELTALVANISNRILSELESGETEGTVLYFSRRHLHPEISLFICGKNLFRQ